MQVMARFSFILLLLFFPPSTIAADYWPFWVAEGTTLYGQVKPGWFAAVDVESGRILWELRDSRFGRFTKPVISDGSVFVAAELKSGSEFIRLNSATGSPEWRVPFVSLAGNASPVSCGETLLLPDFYQKAVLAFHSRSGRVLWRSSDEYSVLHPPAVIDATRAIYVAYQKQHTNNAQLLTLDCANGQILAATRVAEIGGSRNPLLLTNEGLLRFGYDDSPGKSTRLELLELPGFKRRWTMLVRDELSRYTPAAGFGILAAAGKDVWGIDLTDGSVKYRHRLPKPTVHITVQNGLVFLTDGDSHLAALDLHSGTRVWRVRLPGSANSNIVALGDKVAVVTNSRCLAIVSRNGHLQERVFVGNEPLPEPVKDCNP